jgi:hypothetical protein
MPTIEYTVDGERQSTTSQELTPDQIMINAKIDPKKNYLVQLEGKERVSYENKGTSPIKMHEQMKFITVQIGGGVTLSERGSHYVRPT